MHLAAIQWCLSCTTTTTTSHEPHSRARAGVQSVAHRRTSAGTTTPITDVFGANLGQAWRKEA